MKWRNMRVWRFATNRWGGTGRVSGCLKGSLNVSIMRSGIGQFSIKWGL